MKNNNRNVIIFYMDCQERILYLQIIKKKIQWIYSVQLKLKMKLRVKN